MGGISGILSTAIFIGLVIVLFYFCCRSKKKPGANGAVVQISTLDFSPQPAQSTSPTPLVGGLAGYPHQRYPLPPLSGYSQSNMQFGNGMFNPNSQYSTNYNYNNAVPYPTIINGIQGPYPINSNQSSNLPYPVAGHGGISMPMPHSGHSLQNDRPVQSNAPYPQGGPPSAPPMDEDLPPPYHEVVNAKRY